MPIETLHQPEPVVAESMENQPDTALLEAALRADGQSCFVLLDANGRIRLWSKAAERMEGYQAVSMQGEPFARGFAGEEREAGLLEGWLEEAARTGGFRGYGRRCRRDGGSYWAAVNITPVEQGFAVVLRDESDEYARWRHVIDENRLLHFMLRSAPADFWAVTADGEAMGRLPGRWLPGAKNASWYGSGQGIAKEDRTAVLSARQDALLERRAYRVEYRTGEGARWVVEEGVPRLGEGNRVWGVCGYVQDVTRWHQEDKASSEFVAELTQEVRRAASAMLHTIDAAQESAQLGERSALLEGIGEAARGLLARVENVAELGRGSRKKRRLVSFDPTSLVRDVWETAAALATGRGVVLEALLHDELPLRARADATGLRQLLRVLLQHAVEAAEANAALELHCAPQGNGHLLRIEVNYAGEPLAEDLREWLLSPAAAKGDAAMNYGEQGVNLTLARRAADGMEARFEVTSDQAGTSFRCEVELLPAAAQSYRPAPQIQLAGRSVLAVASDRTLRKVLQLRFAALGMRAMTAESGEEAWRLLKEAPPGTFELVLAQYQLPGMSGNELAQRIAGNPRLAELPLATVSMNGEPGQAAAAQEAGFGAYLTPPLPVDLLRGALQVLLAREGGEGELITRFTIAEQRSGELAAV